MVTAIPLSVSAADETPQFYDPVSGKMLSADQLNLTPNRELLFTVEINKLTLGEIFIQDIDGDNWVNVQELISLLDFPIDLKITTADKSNQAPIMDANGWFINPKNQFKIVTDGQEDNVVYNVTYKAETDPLPSDQLKKLNNQYYIPLERALNWFDIEAKADQNNLKLTLSSPVLLPIEERLQRQNRKTSSLVSNFELQNARRDTPYQLIAPVFVDTQISVAKNYTDDYKYNLSLLGSGDLAYMTGRYFLNQSYTEYNDKNTTNLRLSLERNDIDSSLLGPLKASHVSLGDISSATVTNLASKGGIGMRLSNRPYGRLTNSSTTNITGLQQPNWDVELYSNDIFVGSQTVGEDGQYQFLDQPLTVGENVFTLKFFGPQGQREEDTQVYNVGQQSLVDNKLIYDLSLLKQDAQLSDFINTEEATTEDKYNLNLHLEKGLTQQLSLTSDFSQFHFSDGTQHNFVQAGVRFFIQDSLVNLNHLRDIEGGNQSSLAISRAFGSKRAHKLSFNLKINSQDFKLNSSDVSNSKQQQSLSLQGPLLSKALHLNYQLKMGLQQGYDQSTSENYAINLGANISNLRIANNLSYTHVTTPGIESTTNTNGQLQLSSSLGPLYVRSGLSYTLEPDTDINDGSLGLLWNMSNNLSSEAIYSHNFISDSSTQSLSMNWRNRYFTSAFKVSQVGNNTTGSLNLRFGLAHDPLKDEFIASSRRLSNTGAVSALVFEDLNNNQLYDTDEPLIENAEVIAVQQRRRATTDKSGKTFLTGLYGNSPTDIKVKKGSLEDPFWVASTKGISFLPRPGLVKVVMIPIVTSGEVEGTVTYADSLFHPSVDQGSVPLILTNLESQEVIKRNSAFDGFFLFEQVPPGNYNLKVDPNFLIEKQVETRSPFPVIIDHTGTLVMGANFTLHPEGTFDFTTENKISETAYNIDLGTFMSEKNARTVLGALRHVFPGILSKIKSDSTYRILMVKKEAGQFQLLLGPVFDLNHIKYICGSLAKENLHCEVQKTAVKTASIPTKTFESEPLNESVAEPVQKVDSSPESNGPEQSFMNQNFTLQLMNTSNSEGLTNFIHENNLEDAQIIEVEQNNERRFILTVGEYQSRETAEQVAANIHRKLKIKPWIRTFESINSH
jgi:hypothetical protein